MADAAAAGVYPVDPYAVSATGFWDRIVDMLTPSTTNISARYDNVKLTDHFDEYESYNCLNWDGYGAAPITPETLRTARTFMNNLLPTQVEIPTPDIAPGNDGTIGFEWNLSEEFLLVDVGPETSITIRHIDRQGRITKHKSSDITDINLVMVELFDETQDCE